MTFPRSLAPLQSAFGQDFLDQFVEVAGAELGAEMVTVGAFRMFETERVRVCASSFLDNGRAIFEYETLGAPCYEVVSRARSLVVANDVQTQYPRDDFFRKYGFQSYVGVPLRNSVGELIGLVQVSWKRAVDQALCDRALEIFDRFAGRLGHELESRSKLRTLAALVAEADAEDAQGIFASLAQTLQASLAVKTAFIAECIEDQPGYFRILGYCLAGVNVPEMAGRVLPYAGSPCERLLECPKAIVEVGLQQLYPEQSAFVELGLDAYLGLRLTDRSGKTIGHLAVQHDRPMSERMIEGELVRLLARRIEIELQRDQAERLRQDAEAAFQVKQKNESLSLMAGSVAHDFNNLLASMLGHTELALDGIEKRHPAAASLGVVNTCLETATKLAQQLLDYAEGAPSEEMQILDLDLLVQKVARLLPGQSDPCVFRVDQSAGPKMVRGDQTQLTQVMMNLVLNAREAAGPAGADITVRTRRHCLTPAERARLIFEPADVSGECVLLEVLDKGAGMAAETAARVFDPYFTTKTSGRGLGMASVMGIARRHLAALAMETEEGEGTHITIVFPSPEGAVAALEAGQMHGRVLAQDAMPETGLRRKILVVDDEPVLRKMLETALRNGGYDVVIADGYAAALDQLSMQGAFDCAIVDVTMPTKNGWETIDALSRRQPDLVFIMMSGFSVSPEDAGYPRFAGLPFLNKPFRPSTLLDTLSEVLADVSANGLSGRSDDPFARGG